MPPMYSWLDKVTGRTVDIIRKFDQSDEPPTREDIGEKEFSNEELAAAQWSKVLNKPGVVKGWNWGGGKGNW